MLVLALAVALQAQQAPIRVRSTISSADIIVGETTTLVIEIESSSADPDRIELPALPAGLDVVASEEVTESRAAFPGGRTRVTRRTLVLAARIAGQFTIPPARVHTPGRVWESPPLSLVVREAAESQGTDLEDSRIDVSLTPSTAWVGQQILLEATAAFTRGLRTRQTRPATYQSPSPAGFWIHDLPDPLISGLRTVGGRIYETQTFRRAYFPLTPGTFMLPPARLLFEFRRGFLGSTETRALVSDSPRIVVRPLPRQNRPASFRGAVGRYTIEARVPSERLRVGDATTLVVEVSGTGNVKALPPPVLDDPDGLDVHPPSEDATVTVEDDRVGGTKRFTWVLVPERSGDLAVPPIEYAYFDPERGRYQVARTDSIRLSVAEVGPRVPAAQLAPIARSPSRMVALLRSPLFAWAQLVPLLLIAGAWFGRRSLPFERRGRRTELSALARLARVRRVAGADENFHADLAAIIRAALVDRIGPDAVDATSPDAMRAAMQREGLPPEAMADLVDALFAADRARFSGVPAGPDERRALLERTEAALRSIERRRIGRAVPILILLAAGLSAQHNATPWYRGLVFYTRGEFDDAAAAFLEHTRAIPQDAAGWHALGNASYQSERTGEAVHAWLRAARVDPWHRGARTNLRLTVGDAAAPFLPVRFALSWPRAWWLTAGAWWIAGIMAAIAVWRGRSTVRPFSSLAVVVALAIACGGIGSATRPAAVSLREATLLADPALKAEAIDVLPTASIVTVVERRDGWLRVRVRRVEGWIEAALLAEA
nr:BatD family protein [Gemmatimonadota bacterium]